MSEKETLLNKRLVSKTLVKPLVVVEAEVSVQVLGSIIEPLPTYYPHRTTTFHCLFGTFFRQFTENPYLCTDFAQTAII